MKTSIFALVLLGAISSAEARVPNALAQLAPRNVNFLAESSSSDSDSDDALLQLDAETSDDQAA